MSVSDDEVDLESAVGFMQEPEDYYPPDKEPTFELYERKSGKGKNYWFKIFAITYDYRTFENQDSSCRTTSSLGSSPLECWKSNGRLP
jgi:hypothetical protein